MVAMGIANVHSSRPVLSTDAVNAIDRGAVVEAIKLVREQTGVGLKEAKELVEAWSRNVESPSESVGPGSVMPTAALVALQKGKLIDAVKAFREKNGGGLKDSKEAVERYLDKHPLTNRQFREAASLERRRVATILMLILLAVLALGYVLTRGQPG